MLNEKTIELNYTLEIVNYRGFKTGQRAIAFGPSLQAEKFLGFDAAVGAAGQFIFVQYKRAYRENGGLYFKWTYPVSVDS